MGIRRLIDKTSGAQNLYQVLENIKDNACRISIENHAQYMFISKRHKERINNFPDKTTNQKRILIKSYQKDELRLARRAFKKALGKKVQSLRCCDVEEDICKIIQDIKCRIGKLTDKCWAHMDGARPLNIKFCEAHKDLDLLISIYNKYSLLIGVSEFEPDDSVFFNQWDAPFHSL
jgi:hypothetical protein